MYFDILMIAYIGFLIQAVFVESVVGFLMSFIGIFLQLWQLYVYLGADFVGISFLILYAGAISILFVFVFMAIGVKEISFSSELSSFIIFIFTSLVLLGFIIYNVFYNKILDLYFFFYLIPEPWVSGDFFGYTFMSFSTDIIVFCIALYSKYRLLFFCTGFTLLASVFGILTLALPGSRLFSKIK